MAFRRRRRVRRGRAMRRTRRGGFKSGARRMVGRMRVGYRM